jgi:hypothetical protein
MFFAACPMDPDDGPNVEKYTSEKDGKIYVLEITDGSTYVLTITDADGNTVTNSGTVESEAGGVIILKPTTGNNITVATSDGQMTGIEVVGGGKISVTDEEGKPTEEELPGEVVSKDEPKPDTSGGGSVPETNAQVYWRDGKQYTGSGTVKLMYWGEGDSNGKSIATVGTVTDGKLTLSLPAIIPDQYLVYGEDWMKQIPALTITPADVQFGTSMGFDIFYENSQKGFYFGKETSDTHDDVSYMYFSKAAKISGNSSNTSEDGVTQTQSMNIDAKAGWNKIYSSYLQSGNTRTVTYTTDLSKVPSGLKWTIPATGSSSGDNGGGGANTGKTLVITDISAAQASQGQSGFMVGIFQAGTTLQDALQQKGVVTGTDSENVTLSSSAPYTATVSLSDLPNGTYDIYLVLGSGSSASYYRKQNVPFTSASTPVSAATFSPIQLQ